MPRTKVGIAVVGGGYWGTKLTREYLSLSKLRGDFEVYLVERSQERRESIQKEIGDSNLRLSQDYEEVLRNDKIDGVHIATPNTTHYELALGALEKGKHVLLEKPMTLSSRSAFELTRMAKENGLVLQVGHIFRFNNAVEKARQLIRNNELGKTLYANLSWASSLHPPEDHDVVFDLAPHPLDILNCLLDKWPSAVYARGKSYIRKTDLKEEVAFICFEFPDDILGHVYVSWLHRGAKERNVTIVGETATLQIDALNQKLTLIRDEAAREIPVVCNNTIQSMQNHFIDGTKHLGPSSNSAIIGAMSVHVLEFVHKSMNLGQRIEIIGEEEGLGRNTP